MMVGGTWHEAVREAQAGVAEAQTQLLAPTAQALESTWLPLERAAGALRRLIECLRAGVGREARAEVEGLVPCPPDSAVSRAPRESINTGMRRNRSELYEAVTGLGREVARLRALLEGAAALRLGWARRLATACGYTAQGEPALPQMARRVSVEG